MAKSHLEKQIRLPRELKFVKSFCCKIWNVKEKVTVNLNVNKAVHHRESSVRKKHAEKLLQNLKSFIKTSRIELTIGPSTISLL